ncbi:MAG: DUF4209 domain-containing protein [Cyanobacteria bacterium P01_E01_bin.6]
MMLKPASVNEPFAPCIVMDGKRSALPEDLQPDEIDLLSSIYPEIDDPKLCARLADLVWLVQKPKDPNAAIAAIDAYRQVPISRDSWIRDGRDCWNRAVQLCLMLRSGAGERLNEIEQTLLDALLTATFEEGKLALWLADALVKYGLATSDRTRICSHMEGIAKTYDEGGNIHRARDYYECAGDCYRRVGNQAKFSEMSALCAETWVREVISRQSYDSSPSHMVAASFYESAIQKYRTIPRVHRADHDVEARINELRALLSEAGEKSLEEMSVISSNSIDISELVQHSKAVVKGKLPLDALLGLANIYQGAQVQKIREFSKQMMAEHPLQAFFAATHMSADGRVVAKRPGADPGSDGSEDALWAGMVKHYVMELGIVVQGNVWPALEVIRLEHRIRESDFILLARQSPLVPPGRESLVGKALFAGYDNDFVTSIHILVPQLEHLVRFHLKQAGVNTTNLDQNGIEDEHGLSTLMNNMEVQAIFGENVAFEIKALFCDPFGPNLRNELAHGLVGFEQAQSMYSIYVWWLMLRVIFNTFWNARQRAIQQIETSKRVEEDTGA